MKFLMTWSYTADNFLPVLKKASTVSPQEMADVGEGVKLLGRWHDVVGRQTIGILESNDLAAVVRFCGRWNSLGDCVIAPVLDDAEARAVGDKVVADSNA
jgi:uncharacterized protein DUF3303